MIPPHTVRINTFKGIAAGSHYIHFGGGANWLWLPKFPEYLSQKGSNSPSYLYGSEYEVTVLSFNVHNFNVPCAVCSSSSKVMQLMIPAKINCPSDWTREYYGYLMTEHYNHKRNVVYVCIDKDAEGIPGSAGDNNGAQFHHVHATCSGIPCPPYVSNKVIACVVCTK